MVNLHGATRKRSEVPLDQLLESVGNVRDARWQGKPVRYIPKSDGPWFVLADVLGALDYKVKPSHIKKALQSEAVAHQESLTHGRMPADGDRREERAGQLCQYDGAAETPQLQRETGGTGLPGMGERG